MKVLVTGGAGYIGSHTVVLLLAAGHDVLIFDDFSNSAESVIGRIGTIAQQVPEVVRGDIRDHSHLSQVVGTFQPDAIIHFAALKSNPESIRNPVEYFDVNLNGTLALVRAALTHGIRNFVYSSSASVYGAVTASPIPESQILNPVTPYGCSKMAAERLLAAVAAVSSEFRVGVLRYFNPVGAHESGYIGDDPTQAADSLIPVVSSVAIGDRAVVDIFGSDYSTPDGTGVRDYVHVMDLAEAHLRTLSALADHQQLVLNIGTGQGCSVRQVVRAFEQVAGESIPQRENARRAGDVDAIWADCSQAEAVLRWKPRKSLMEMCADQWRWQQFKSGGMQL